MYVCDNGFHGHDCGEILQSEIKYEKESKKLYKKLSPQIVKRLSLLIAVFLILLSVCPAEARENRPEEEKKIVILMDCSQSMMDFDENRLAFDFINEVIHTAPRHYQFGVIGYNREVCIRFPLGSDPEEIDSALKDTGYKDYGNAGEGLSAALSVLEQGRGSKRILLITDGENMMESEEHTEESVSLFEDMVEKASGENIRIDIINLGGRIEDEANVYGAAQGTGGLIYDLESGDDFENFAEKYLFGEMGVRSQPSGRIDGSSGDLTVRLPDHLMEKAKILLAGRQQDINLTVNCESEGLQVFKGINYSLVEIAKPASDEVKIHMSSENTLGINAYLMAEYDCHTEAAYDYVSETQMAEIRAEIKNPEGRSLLDGHLKEGGFRVYINGEESQYRISQSKILADYRVIQDESVKLEVDFDSLYGNYYGKHIAEINVVLPVAEEEEPVDWFFRSVIFGFAIVMLVLFCMLAKRGKKQQNMIKATDDSIGEDEKIRSSENDFCGKLLIYVIRSKNDIDYPPESINLFARCNRDMITLEWLLDACGLPLDLPGADKIIIRPGENRSLTVKNNSRASAMKGREILAKGCSCSLYYYEKVTFIFDQEDTEIEVHYRDLKPDERQGR
jgi:hypothetical protein